MLKYYNLTFFKNFYSFVLGIRPKSATRQQRIKTKDPVELYQYYQKEWERFKQNLPGENDHMELRWKIRHKLLGANND